jgi:hypothetical protein
VSSPALQAELLRCLSQPRLGTYQTACGNDFDRALELYVWNGQAAAAFLESMHFLEVALRNVLNDALTSTWSPTWYKDAGVPLNPGARNKIRDAISRATDDGAIPEIPGRVVAELTFGFWWSLLAVGYDRTLWPRALKAAFPASARRGRLHTSLDQMRLLRNRCAHHEPIFVRDLALDWSTLLRTTGVISPAFRAWVQSVSRVPAVLAAKPIP